MAGLPEAADHLSKAETEKADQLSKAGRAERPSMAERISRRVLSWNSIYLTAPTEEKMA